MKNRIVQQFRLWRAVNQAVRSGQPDIIKKLIEENPELKARFPDGQIEQVLKGIGENKRLNKISQRPLQYTVTNGTGELACGTMWLGMALGGLWSQFMPASVWSGWMGKLFPILGFVVGWFFLWAGRRLVVQSRVGYFALRSTKSRWIGMAVGIIVAVAISRWLVVRGHTGVVPSLWHPAHHAISTAAANAPANWADMAIVAGSGELFALLYLMVNAVSIRQHRWKWACLALLLLIPPAIILLLPGNMARMQLPMTFFQSLIWLFSGGVTLVWFLRHHKPIAPETE